MHRLLLLLPLFLLTTCTQPLAKKRLLVIGDSNGEKQGWVYELQNLRGGGPLVNTALSGNTVGFNYGGNRTMNTLENLTTYLRKGYAEMGGIDEVLIGLGTNDCKVDFADRRADIEKNLNLLLDRSVAFFEERGQEVPNFVLLTPPPLDDTNVVAEFADATACVAAVAATVKKIGAERGYCVVDLQSDPGDAALEHSYDGIHYRAPGYKMLAGAVIDACY